LTTDELFTQFKALTGKDITLDELKKVTIGGEVKSDLLFQLAANKNLVSSRVNSIYNILVKQNPSPEDQARYTDIYLSGMDFSKLVKTISDEKLTQNNVTSDEKNESDSIIARLIKENKTQVQYLTDQLASIVSKVDRDASSAPPTSIGYEHMTFNDFMASQHSKPSDLDIFLKTFAENTKPSEDLQLQEGGAEYSNEHQVGVDEYDYTQVETDIEDGGMYEGFRTVTEGYIYPKKKTRCYLNDNRLSKAQGDRNKNELGFMCNQRTQGKSNNDTMTQNMSWTIPHKHPPVCMQNKYSARPLFMGTTLSGTAISDAKNTAVGTIMPKFKYEEKPSQ
jgi:hypothetical protein